MIKNDIADRLEKKGNTSRTKAVYLVDAILDSIKEALLRGEKVEIRGFGSFRVVPKKSGYGRDIRRNKQMAIGGGQRVKFRPGQDFKRQLKKQSDKQSSL
ncbi:MAG TPA: HU family DNA-binding protein [Candidatus Saccharicenans sp.]|nr:HU family DNA-binding protein [Candidatus Saccharicenans sp.]HPU93470.1 HU family DNA-binding protein [Candidatus Saccharicenans sp.]